MTTQLSKAEKRALLLMANASHQDGVIDRHGNVVCDGEHKSISPATWLRLVARGYVMSGLEKGLRLRLNEVGRLAVERLQQ